MSRPTEVSGICSITRPPASADSANIEPLYATRSGGRWPMRCVTVGPPAATITPACQPNNTVAATAKTKPSVTPPASTPSTGTGNRSASTMPTKRPATAPRSEVVCDVRPYVTPAATIVAIPAVTTGATMARTLGGTEAGAFTAPPRPQPAEGQVRALTPKTCRVVIDSLLVPQPPK